MKAIRIATIVILILGTIFVYFFNYARNYQAEIAYAIQYCRAESLLVSEQYGHGRNDVICSFDHDFGWSRDKISLLALKSDKAPTVWLVCTKKYSFFHFYEMENCEFDKQKPPPHSFID